MTPHYTFITGLFHFIVAFVLFFLINWVGTYSKPFGYMQLAVIEKEESYPFFNLLYKVLAPVVIMLILAAFLQTMKLQNLIVNVFMVVVFYWLIRIAYVILFSRCKLTNWGSLFVYCVMSIVLAFWIGRVIDKVDSIFPDPKTLIEQFWFCIILFLYTVFNSAVFSRKSTIKRKERYIKEMYQRFVCKYGPIVDRNCGIPEIKVLLYSIMIFENFNRPPIARFVEKIMSKFSKKKHSYGIMQIQSEKYVDDRKSIELALEKIKNDICEEETNNGGNSLYVIITSIISKYNGGVDYQNEVYGIYQKITDDYFPHIDLYKECKLIWKNI